MDTARFTKAWLKIGAARKDLKAEYEAADKELAAQQEAFGGALLGFLNDNSQDSVTIAGIGKFSRKEDLKPSAEDWSVIYDWIKANDAWELLHKRLGKTFVEKYAELHGGEAPPGVKVYREFVLSVTRAA